MDNFYASLENEFNGPMQEAGIVFKEKYNETMDSFKDFPFDTRDQKYKAVQAVLSNILQQYIDSKAKTDAGGFGRKVAKIIITLLPFLKYIKFNKKK